MATDQTITGTFVDPQGNPLANGYLVMRLSHDGQSATPNQVVSSLTQRVTLNSSGQIGPAVAIYSNTGLLPANTFYRITVYAADGPKSSRCPQLQSQIRQRPLIWRH